MIAVDECCVRCGSPARSESLHDLLADEYLFARRCACSAEPRVVCVPAARFVEGSPQAIVREIDATLGPVMLAPRTVTEADGRDD